MFRRLVSAAIVLLLCVGITVAAEINALIVRVDDGKVTFYEIKGRGKDAMKSDTEKTLPAADNVKVFKTKFNKETMKAEVGDAIEGGLKHEMFTKEKLGEK